MKSQRDYSYHRGITCKPSKDILWPDTAQVLLWPKLKLIKISQSMANILVTQCTWSVGL